MGAGPSMAMQAAMTGSPDASDAVREEAEAQDVRRLRWILRVANNPSECEEWYIGDEHDGMRHGDGAAFYTSGDVYHGQWHKGAWHGRGSLTHMSGAKYTGQFEKGEQHGSGEFLDVDGVRFRGEYRRGRRHGPGFMVSPNGAQFEGWFREDVPNGDGILTWQDGGKFIGKYVSGKEHGRGQILDPFGCKVCDVECAQGVLVGGRTVCPGSLGAGKGPKCRGGSQSCGFCLQTALDLELSITHEQPDALQALSWRGNSAMSSSGAQFSTRSRVASGGAAADEPGGGWEFGVGGSGQGNTGGGGHWNGCVVRIKARPSARTGGRTHSVSRPGSTAVGGR